MVVQRSKLIVDSAPGSIPLEPLNSHDEQVFRLVIAPNGLPTIFSLGSDGNLYLTTTEDGSQVLWANYSLTNFLPTKGLGTAFDLYQDPLSKQFMLFVATFDSKQNPHLYQTIPLPTNFDGSTTDDFWKEISLPSSLRGLQISNIYASTSTIVITTQDKLKDAQIYHLTAGSCQLLLLPVNAGQIIDLQNGRLQIPTATIAGSFIFCKAGIPEVIFLPFPDQPLSGSHHYQLPRDFLVTATSMAVLTTADPTQGSLLYVAGNGVFECRFLTANACRIIVPVAADILYHSLTVVGSFQEQSLYMLQELSDSSTVLASASSNQQQNWWSPPTVLAVNAALPAKVKKFASTLKQDAESKQFTDHIVLIDESNKIQHLTQTTTGQWVVTPILLPSLITPALVAKIREAVNFTSSRATFLQELRNYYEQLATRLVNERDANRAASILNIISSVITIVGLFLPPLELLALATSLISNGISMGAILDQLVKTNQVMMKFDKKLDQEKQVCILFNSTLSFLATYKGQLNPLLSALFEVTGAEFKALQNLGGGDPQTASMSMAVQLPAEENKRPLKVARLSSLGIMPAASEMAMANRRPVEIELHSLAVEEVVVAEKTEFALAKLRANLDSIIAKESQEVNIFMSRARSISTSKSGGLGGGLAKAAGGIFAVINLAISIKDIITTWNSDSYPPQMMDEAINSLDKSLKIAQEFCETSQFTTFNNIFDSLLKFDQEAGFKIDDTMTRINNKVLELLKRREREKEQERQEECTYVAILY